MAWNAAEQTKKIAVIAARWRYRLFDGNMDFPLFHGVPWDIVVFNTLYLLWTDVVWLDE